MTEAKKSMKQDMKLSDYVIAYLHAQGTKHVFGMSGGAAVHLFDSAAKHASVGTTFVAHEQSAAMAADGYYRVSGRIGACIVTSGPGATNLLTGVCCSYYDSVPALMLTGQVATHRLKGARKVRQVGFQETDALSIYSSVTKYAEQLRVPSQVAYTLDKAYAEAQAGRPGPVLIDIPDDLQRAHVDTATLTRYAAPAPGFRKTSLAASSAPSPQKRESSWLTQTKARWTNSMATASRLRGASSA
jgi:acetolactate synthase-1/2/3 large subunit